MRQILKNEAVRSGLYVFLRSHLCRYHYVLCKVLLLYMLAKTWHEDLFLSTTNPSFLIPPDGERGLFLMAAAIFLGVYPTAFLSIINL